MRFTSTTPPTEVRLSSLAPPTRMRFASATPPTGAGLTSVTLSIWKRLIYADPPTRMRLTLAGLFFIVKYILATAHTAPVFLASQVAPLSSMTRQTAKTRFLVHPIMTSPSKTAGDTPFTATLKAYLLAVLFSPQSKKNTSQINSKK